MRNTLPGRLFLLLLLLSAVFFSCSGKSRIADIAFPPTYVVEARNRFVVVVHPYAALRDQPGESGVTIGHCRKGDVFELTGTRFVESGGNQMLWVCLEGGWILRSSVILFSTRAQAENAAAGILAKDASGSD